MFLTADEVAHLTGRKRPTHQARQLELMGIPFIRPPKGARGRSGDAAGEQGAEDHGAQASCAANRGFYVLGHDSSLLT
jgi:hypothetical protein